MCLPVPVRVCAVSTSSTPRWRRCAPGSTRPPSPRAAVRSGHRAAHRARPPRRLVAHRVGERLARMYHELDLLVVEAIEAGLFDGLAPSEVAALASTFIFEERRSHDVPEPWFPTDELRRRFGKLTRLHRTLANHEHRLRLNETRVPDAGFMAVAHSWAAGGHLDQVLDDEELTAGDFVRTARLLIDLLRQIAQLAIDPATQRAARAASDAVHRDLVAVSSAIDLDGDELDDDGLDLDGLEDDGLDDVGLDQDGLDRASDS
ncbi:MAG: hypothetical protein R2710_17610 [Acidimicrobiales bacterium]